MKNLRLYTAVFCLFLFLSCVENEIERLSPQCANRRRRTNGTVGEEIVVCLLSCVFLLK
jgi:hypothetical protein